MKRLLSIDGGGIRGVFSLQILVEMERQLQEDREDPSYLLSDHFHYIGGTSTGAIVAACLSWGIPASEILDLYLELGSEMFRKRPVWQWHRAKFHPEGLTEMLKKTFSEDGDGRELALLGTKRLRTHFMAVTRNATTGSPWPLTNNPGAKFNQAGTPGNNLLLPLWQVVRASTAAPSYYPAERVVITGEAGDAMADGVECLFEDGGVTPYNNPAHLLYLKATLPEYGLGWPVGKENLHLVSVGTGYVKQGRKSTSDRHLLENATFLPLSLIQSYQQNQDLACRISGETLFGAPIDSELGDLIRPKAQSDFTYVRYNHLFTEADLVNHPGVPPALPIEDLRIVPFLNEFGKTYAQKHVELGHLR